MDAIWDLLRNSKQRDKLVSKIKRFKQGSLIKCHADPNTPVHTREPGIPAGALCMALYWTHLLVLGILNDILVPCFLTMIPISFILNPYNHSDLSSADCPRLLTLTLSLYLLPLDSRGLYLPFLFCPEINPHVCNICASTTKVLIMICKAVCNCQPFLPDAWRLELVFEIATAPLFIFLLTAPTSFHASFPCLTSFITLFQSAMVDSYIFTQATFKNSILVITFYRKCVSF